MNSKLVCSVLTGASVSSSVNYCANYTFLCKRIMVRLTFVLNMIIDDRHVVGFIHSYFTDLSSHLSI